MIDEASIVTHRKSVNDLHTIDDEIDIHAMHNVLRTALTKS